MEPDNKMTPTSPEKPEKTTKPKEKIVDVKPPSETLVTHAEDGLDDSRLDASLELPDSAASMQMPTGLKSKVVKFLSVLKEPKVLVLVVLAVLILAGAIAATTLRKSEPQPTKVFSAQESVVEITNSGFVPQTITVKVGSVVTWKNTSGSGRQISAEPFPTGDSLPELKNDEAIEAGDTYTFMFEKTGTYNYYDYASPETIKGTIIVN